MNTESNLCTICRNTGEGYTPEEPCPECGAWQPGQTKEQIERIRIEPRVVVPSPQENRQQRRARFSNWRKAH